MSNFIDYFYQNFLYEPFIFVAGFFVSERYGVFILLGIIIVLSIVVNKLRPKFTEKLKYVPKILDLFIGLLFILLLFVIFVKYQATIENFFKSDTTPKTNTEQTNPSSNTKTTPSQNTTTPTYQAPKQLYYAVSCYGCYNDSCPRNGYSYGGYIESYYTYYRSLCQSCGCTSYRAQSLWR